MVSGINKKNLTVPNFKVYLPFSFYIRRLLWFVRRTFILGQDGYSGEKGGLEAVFCRSVTSHHNQESRLTMGVTDCKWQWASWLLPRIAAPPHRMITLTDVSHYCHYCQQGAGSPTTPLHTKRHPCLPPQAVACGTCHVIWCRTDRSKNLIFSPTPNIKMNFL